MIKSWEYNKNYAVPFLNYRSLNVIEGVVSISYGCYGNIWSYESDNKRNLFTNA